MKKKLSYVVLVLLSVFFVVSCSSDDIANENQATQQEFESSSSRRRTVNIDGFIVFRGIEFTQEEFDELNNLPRRERRAFRELIRQRRIDEQNAEEEEEEEEEQQEEEEEEEEEEPVPGQNEVIIPNFTRIAIDLPSFTSQTAVFPNRYANGGNARITDFTSDANFVSGTTTLPEDVLDFSLIDANTNTPQNDAFVRVNSFSGRAGEIIITDPIRSQGNGGGNPSSARIMGDVDGDGEADFNVTLSEVSFPALNDPLGNNNIIF